MWKQAKLPVRRLQPVAAAAWPLIQQAAAATVAWVIARNLVDHHDPFFAPIAAVVALNASFGERGLNALRLLGGVMVGILAGEGAVRVVGNGYPALGLATLVALFVARAFTKAPIVVAQAAAAAILTVATTTGSGGVQRLGDALIGAGVALVFSQVIFTPEPIRLLRRAETSVLQQLAAGLLLTADSLEHHDATRAEQGLTVLRNARNRVGEVARTRLASTRMVRHSVLWRSQRAPVVRETENADYLDLLAGSCVLLARTAAAADGQEQTSLSGNVRRLETAVAEMAADVGSRSARQHAADQARMVAMAPDHARSNSAVSARVALALVASDVMAFAGVELEDAGRHREPE